MNQDLADLIEAQEILAALDSPACQRVAGRLHQVLTEKVDPFEALGIPKRGKRWYDVNSTRARDELIKEVGELFYDQRSKAATGRAIEQDFRRYETGVWPRMKHHKENPHPVQSRYSYWWRLLSEHDGAPGWDTIRRLW